MTPLREDIEFWLHLPMTREFIARMAEYFDAHRALLCTSPGESADFLRGRAEVLEKLRNPRTVFEE